MPSGHGCLGFSKKPTKCKPWACIYIVTIEQRKAIHAGPLGKHLFYMSSIKVDPCTIVMLPLTPIPV